MLTLSYPASLLRRTMCHGIKRFSGDEEGVSALEFALIAPLLLLLYFGSLELSLLMLADRRVTATSSTVGDLASRFTVITDTDRDNIFAAAQAILPASQAAGVELRLSSLENVGGTIMVQWSDSNSNTTPLSPGATVTDIPMGVLEPGSTMLMAEAEFNHVGLGLFLMGTTRLSERFFLRPRQSDQVDRT